MIAVYAMAYSWKTPTARKHQQPSIFALQIAMAGITGLGQPLSSPAAAIRPAPVVYGGSSWSGVSWLFVVVQQ
jgi:hypothetical protein